MSFTHRPAHRISASGPTSPAEQQARVDLELATRDYRGNQLAEKGKAGFSIYAPADDASRVRAAAQDPHLILEILSL